MTTIKAEIKKLSTQQTKKKQRLHEQETQNKQSQQKTTNLKHKINKRKQVKTWTNRKAVGKQHKITGNAQMNSECNLINSRLQLFWPVYFTFYCNAIRLTVCCWLYNFEQYFFGTILSLMCLFKAFALLNSYILILVFVFVLLLLKLFC